MPAKKKDRSGRRPHGNIVRGTDGVKMSVDLARIELPSQEYEADVLWPMVRRGAVSFMLDRLSLGDPSRVEARVEVRMPFESFLAFCATTQNEPFAGSLRRWVAANPQGGSSAEEAKAPRLDNQDPEGGRGVVRAHLARLSHVGSDAELSFYAVSASHMADAVTDAATNTVPLAGVLRVTTTTHALAELLSACAHLREEITHMMSKEAQA